MLTPLDFNKKKNYPESNQNEISVLILSFTNCVSPIIVIDLTIGITISYNRTIIRPESATKCFSYFIFIRLKPVRWVITIINNENVSYNPRQKKKKKQPFIRFFFFAYLYPKHNFTKKNTVLVNRSKLHRFVWIWSNNYFNKK